MIDFVKVHLLCQKLLLLAILLELLFFPNYAKRYGKVAEERCPCAERKRQRDPLAFPPLAAEGGAERS